MAQLVRFNALQGWTEQGAAGCVGDEAASRTGAAAPAPLARLEKLAICLKTRCAASLPARHTGSIRQQCLLPGPRGCDERPSR